MKANLDAMERIMKLLDEKSFVELSKGLDAGVITGYGRINMRPVYVFSQNISEMSGAFTEGNCEKICRIIDMAMKNGIPVIGFYDSLGVKITEGFRILKSMDKLLSKFSEASGIIPIIASVNGSIVGIASYMAIFSDFVFMIDKKSRLFVNGPQVVTSIEGKTISEEELGGAQVHFENSGICHFISKNEDENVKAIRKLFGYLPENSLCDAEIIEKDDLNRICDLDDSFDDVRKVICETCDGKDFVEIQAGFAKNIVIGLGRVAGRVCGFVANQRSVLEGKLDINASDKASRFVGFCDRFNIPVIAFTDCTGFVVSFDEEHNGLGIKSSELLSTFTEADIPKINVIVGEAYGSGVLVMNSSFDITFAWNSAKIAIMEPKTAVNILFNEEISGSEDPVKFREEKIKEFSDETASAENAMKEGYIDDIVQPSSTRKRIISALEMSIGKIRS